MILFSAVRVYVRMYIRNDRADTLWRRSSAREALLHYNAV